MPKPFPLKRLLRILKDKGFFLVSQKGSHAKFKKHGTIVLTVIVPIHGKEIPYGTIRSILRQANLDESDLID
jgi:predicted RNA binding protein YcfA (HicA-like mRNA interferase family)